MSRHPAAFSDEFISDVAMRVSQGKRVRRFLPEGGRLHLDRRLPFLCVYRKPVARNDAATEKLISGEAASLTVSGDPKSFRRIRLFLERLLKDSSEYFGAFCLVEVWSDPDFSSQDTVLPETGESVPPKPLFRVIAARGGEFQGTVDSLAQALQRVRISRRPAVISREASDATHPRGMKPLVPPHVAKRHRCFCIGLEVRPIYRDPATHDVFPGIVRSLRRGLAHALKRAFFTFERQNTRVHPEHFDSLGRRSFLKVVWEIDRRLAEIDDSFDLLLQATPVNVEAAWREFRRSGFDRTPTFLYRPLTVEPSLLKRRLFDLPIERVEDPTLAHLFLEKQDELDRKVTMLADVGSADFLLGSQQVYGRVTRPLLSLAKEILERFPRPARRRGAAKEVDALAFAARAQREIESYRGQHAGFHARVEVRDDVYAGLLVSGGVLLVGRRIRIPASRVDALLQHEVGTHLVTFYNGRAQPFRQLNVGLSGYDELQEGLAVLSEFLVGGLDSARARLLAARVIAVEQLLRGASFADCFRAVTREYGFAQRQAFTMTMRVYRAGGLTKDVVYLQGLTRILEYLRDGGELEPLVVGKIGADHIPVVKELSYRKVLQPPPLRPRYLDVPGVAERLQRIRQGHPLLQLLKDVEK